MSLITTLVLFLVVHVYDENEYNSMISEQEIKDWWERKIANYLKNYARRNELTIAQEREKFFFETHENFVESIPFALKNLMDDKFDR